MTCRCQRRHDRFRVNLTKAARGALLDCFARETIQQLSPERLDLQANEKGAPKDALDSKVLTAIKRSCDDDADQPEQQSPSAEALQQQEPERQQPR